MDLRQAEILLEKINRLFKSMKMDESNISRIEKDLMINYIRDYYELFIPDEEEEIATKPVVKPTPKVRKQVTPPPPKVEIRDPEFDAIPDEEPEIVEPEPVVVKPVRRTVKPKPVKVVHQEPVIEEQPAPEPVQRKPEPPVQPARPEPSAANGIKADHVALFKEKKAKDLSDALSTLPISDLAKAFSINDRILTQNDLFDGDTLGFNVTLEKLNKLNNIDEAKAYLSQNVVDKYDWTAKTKVKAARVFVQLVSRRYK